jgi:hypothetical protein
MTERWSSPARSTAPELNGGEGAGPSGRGAALGSRTCARRARRGEVARHQQCGGNRCEAWRWQLTGGG